MACGLAHRDTGDTQRFIDAVACGQKYETPHFKHHCMICGNRGTEICESECFYGTVCHFKQEDPQMVREVVAAVLLAIQDIKDGMAERREPAEIGVSTGPFMGE